MKLYKGKSEERGERYEEAVIVAGARTPVGKAKKGRLPMFARMI